MTDYERLLTITVAAPRGSIMQDDPAKVDIWVEFFPRESESQHELGQKLAAAVAAALREPLHE